MRIKVRQQRGFAERGSALMLVPSGVLVLMVLGAISVDSASAFMGQRELQNRTVAAANDAATAAISQNQLSILGADARPSVELMREIARQRLNSYPVSNLHVEDVKVSLVGDDVVVEAVGHVDYLFAKAVPGASTGQQVAAKTVAQLKRSDG